MNKKRLIELRCKAWGITEDEYYCNQCSDFSLEDMARAYRRGKNKGRAETVLLSQHILELQADKGRLTDRVKELEARIEKMKCCGNCDVGDKACYVRTQEHVNICPSWKLREIKEK